jgi:hypothetical protein
MKTLMVKWVKRWSKKERVEDTQWLAAIADIEASSTTADLGGSLYKVRMSTKSKGKSGGYRVLIVYKKGNRAIILYVFEKADQSNLTAEETKAFKKLSSDYLVLKKSQLELLVERKELFEIIGEKK